MPDRILFDQIATGSSLTPFSSSGSGLQRFGRIPRIPERELARQVQATFARPPHRRTKLWEFGTNLHCSIIGTCLSTADLRQTLIKIGLREADTATEHELHASGVLIAGKQHGGAKLLHQALDRRHRVAINQFDRAKMVAEVRALWGEAVQRGEIPGAYWAALTHPATDDTLVRAIFSEVHMLSHLVGAANRADIRRLRQLEAENAQLEAKMARQEQQLRDAAVARDAAIRELTRELENHLTRGHRGVVAASVDPKSAVWESLAADLKRRVEISESRRRRAEAQLQESRSDLAAERYARAAIKRRESQLQRELDAIEASLVVPSGTNGAGRPAQLLTDITVLYVGGRQAQIGHLRAFAERSDAIFLHHDGGVEERGGLLPGLVSRADIVMFPVDCVSHASMSLVKRLCRQTGKPFLPLRSAALAPFCAALAKLDLDREAPMRALPPTEPS